MPGLGIGLRLTSRRRRASAWNPGRLPGTPREWLAGPDWCYTDGSAAFTAASSQSLSVASNSGLQTGGASFWFSCWANHTTVSGDQAYAGKRNTGEFEWGLWHRDATFTRFQLINRTTGIDTQADAPSATAGSWRHLFCWYDAVANTANISVNGGTPVTVTNTQTLTAGTAPLMLGAFNAGLTFPYNGRLASVAFGKSPPGGIASVATPIRDRLYAGGNGIVYADTTSAERTAWGLVSWWDLVRSGNFTDSHGTNNLTNNNGVGFGAGLPRARAGDTDPVSAWVDRWQGTTVSQTDPLRRPTLRLVSGKWAVRFDGSNDGLSNSGSVYAAQPVTFGYAANPMNPSPTNAYNVFDTFDNGPGSRLISGTTTTGWRLYAGAGTIQGGSYQTGNRVVTGLASGASSVLRVGGTQIAAGNPGSVAFPTGIVIGNDFNLSNQQAWNGDIYSLVLTGSNASADFATIEAYLTGVM